MIHVQCGEVKERAVWRTEVLLRVMAGVGEGSAVDRRGGRVTWVDPTAEAHVSPGWVPQGPLVLSRGYLLTSHSPHPTLQAPRMVSHSPPGLSPL